MDPFVTYVVPVITVVVTLTVRYMMTRFTHSGSVRVSDAETIFKASESVRNDMSAELLACRKDRDHYLEELTKCLEGKHG